jgi:hypothetical protein
MKSLPELSQVAHALSRARRFPCLAKRGHEDAHQHRDNRDHNQQLNDCKRRASTARTYHQRSFILYGWRSVVAQCEFCAREKSGRD